jgi:hypothetical protein
MLCINSCIITVFHTHAHQNNHTFHHFSIGATRSNTFIHVSKTSALLLSSVKAGDGLCIGRCSFHLMFSFQSIASHKTLNILHNTSGHTGTLIGACVFITTSHLFNQSVVSIAIHLTTQSSNCCKTSIVKYFHSEFFASVFTAS